MGEKDIFNNKTWNFLQGDRQIESIICDLPRQATLVLRNDWRHVLATLAGIRDLAYLGWPESGFIGELKVPLNTLTHCPLNQVLTVQDWRQHWLTGHGILWQKQIPTLGQVLLLIHPTNAQIAESDPRILTQILALLPRFEHLILILPQGQTLHPEFRDWARKSRLALYFNGLNAFAHPVLEEVLQELNPESINIAGFHSETVCYTAIGAADYFIGEDAQFRNPQNLSPSEICLLGQKVAVLAPAVNWSGSPEIGELQLHLQYQLQQILGVKDIAPDVRFQASSEDIAIDIF